MSLHLLPGAALRRRLLAAQRGALAAGPAERGPLRTEAHRLHRELLRREAREALLLARMWRLLARPAEAVRALDRAGAARRRLARLAFALTAGGATWD